MSSRHSATPSEGEVYSSDSEKAHPSLPSRNGANVDRRIRDYSSASRSRSRSPYKAPRGEKRRYHDRSRERERNDPRHFRVRYEDDYNSNWRHRRETSYEDLDPGHSPRRAYLPYDDDDGDRRSSHKRQRTRSRSRSPYHRSRKSESSKHNSREDRDHRDKHRGTRSDARDAAVNSRSRREQSVSEREQTPGVAHVFDTHAETKNSQGAQTSTTNEPKSTEDAVSNPSGPVDEAAIIEERRKRREAIRAKYRAQPASLLVQALQKGGEGGSPASSTNATKASSLEPDSPRVTSPQSPRETSVPRSPAEFDFSKDENLVNLANSSAAGNDEGPSAADYDPTVDMQEERSRHDKSMFHEDNKSLAEDVAQISGQSKETAGIPQPVTKKTKDEFDMFADDGDDDDMFAPVNTNKHENATSKGPAQALDINMMDNWDDPEGYYVTIAGELFASRYAVMHSLGRGMFSSVIRAKDTQTDKLVAIKIIRNNDTMKRAGLKEISILETLMAADPNDTKHLIRLLTSFEHKGHLCLVFENLSLNLRELLKKFGRDVGLNIKAIRSYTQQLFLSLSLMKKCAIVHADLKPDNILCSDNHAHLKLCDLGSASPVADNEIAPYLVSRFYRAPEVMLGMDYDCGIDVWSLGCTLFELYTGKILFTGRNNNGMLKAIMECRGPFPPKLLRKGTLTYDHFDDLLNFHSREEDKITGRMVTKMLNFKKPTRDLRSRVMPKGKKMEDTERKEIEMFLDLLEKCLDLRPEKRITPTDALRHPFIARGIPVEKAR